MRPIVNCFIIAGISLFSGNAYACQITASSSFQNLLDTFFWMSGGTLTVAGFSRLYAARRQAKNGKWNRSEVKAAVLRFLTGFLLLAFPFIQTAMQGTISNGELLKINPPFQTEKAPENSPREFKKWQ